MAVIVDHLSCLTAEVCLYLIMLHLQYLKKREKKKNYARHFFLEFDSFAIILHARLKLPLACLLVWC